MEYHGYINVSVKVEENKIETIEKLQCWIFNHPQFVNPHLTNWHINIRDNITVEVKKDAKK